MDFIPTRLNTNGSNSATLTASMGSDRPQIARSYIAKILKIRLGLGLKECSCGLTFVALSRVTSLNGLLFIEKLDWARVKKLGGKFLQL